MKYKIKINFNILIIIRWIIETYPETIQLTEYRR